MTDNIFENDTAWQEACRPATLGKPVAYLWDFQHKSGLATPLLASEDDPSAYPVYRAPEAADCSVQVMQTSAGADYFVAVKVGDRELTPYVFKERYKAEYETAMYRWLLNGAEKPDLMAYGPDGWPETPAMTRQERGGDSK
jgi:hypothetical protein